MAASEGIPLHGDRGAWDSINYGPEHAKGIDDGALRRHLPLPGAAGGYARSDGTDWQRVGALPLADLADYARGVVIRGGATDYEAYSAKTNHFVLIGDGTDIVSRALIAADLPAEYVRLDGTLPLTAPWDAGPYKITAETFESDVAIGAAPLIVTSTTVVTNLNADLLDGEEGAWYAPASAISGTAGRVAMFGAGGDTVVDSFLVGPAAHLLTLAAGGAYTLTVPETLIVAGRDVANTFVAVQTFDENILQADAKYIATDQIRARDAGGLALYDDGGNGIFIEDGGDVGIGTTDPAKKLEIAEPTGDSVMLIRGGTSNSINGDAYLIFKALHSYGFDSPVAKIWVTRTSDDNTKGADMHLMTRDHYGNIETRIFIEADGKVGVNERDPLAQIHTTVSGAAVIGQIIQLYASPSENALEVWAGDDSVLSALTFSGGAEFSGVVTVGDGTNQLVISAGGVVTLEGTAQRVLAIRPDIDYVTQIAHAKPTQETRGVYKLYSFPVYAADDEQLIFHANVPGRWNGSSDITFHVLCALGGAEDVGDYFKFRLSWESTHAGEVVPATSHAVDVEQIVLVGRNAAHDQYELMFVIDWDADGVGNEIRNHDLLGATLYRVDATNPDVTNEINVLDYHLHYPVNKMFAAA